MHPILKGFSYLTGHSSALLFLSYMVIELLQETSMSLFYYSNNVSLFENRNLCLFVLAFGGRHRLIFPVYIIWNGNKAPLKLWANVSVTASLSVTRVVVIESDEEDDWKLFQINLCVFSKFALTRFTCSLITCIKRRPSVIVR